MPPLTWRKVQQIAYGEMKMSEREFWKCRPLYFKIRLEGMRKAQEQAYKNQWELARWATATGMAPHLKNPIAPKKLVAFPWDDVEPDIVATVTKYADIFAKLTPSAQA